MTAYLHLVSIYLLMNGWVDSSVESHWFEKTHAQQAHQRGLQIFCCG
jgi:hypothetical protein